MPARDPKSESKPESKPEPQSEETPTSPRSESSTASAASAATATSASESESASESASASAGNIPAGYQDLLEQLKQRVRASQLRTAAGANAELLRLYYSIGHDILTRQHRDGWGTKVITRLASDLRAAFPDQRGFSPTNLQYMRAFAAAWPPTALTSTPEAGVLKTGTPANDTADSDGQVPATANSASGPTAGPIAGPITGADDLPTAVGKLPWGHVRILLDRLNDRTTRDWYATHALHYGWSRNVLEHHIATRLREREGAAPSNFTTHLPPPDSDLAQQLTRDPYVFDHLAHTDRASERALEQALMDRLQQTLSAFGHGMAFVGRQMHFNVDGDELIIDLLFFHVEQLRYVVVELKIGRFEPAYLGQLGTYVAMIDDRLRRPQHAPTVGILLVAGRNETLVRYALSSAAAPVAVATYDTLPPDQQAALPDLDQLTSELSAVLTDTLGDNLENTPEGSPLDVCDTETSQTSNARAGNAIGEKTHQGGRG